MFSSLSTECTVDALVIDATNPKEYNGAITCKDNETALFAFDRFETFDDNDYLTMTDKDDVVIYSKCCLR